MRVSDAKSSANMKWGLTGLFFYLVPAVVFRYLFADDICARMGVTSWLGELLTAFIMSSATGLIACYIPLQVLRAMPYLEKSPVVILPREGRP